MRVYRLARERYSADLSGKGSELAGGRWNTVGTKMLYTCSSKALCLVEILVHINADIIPTDYVLITLEIPDPFNLEEVDIQVLNNHWKRMPWNAQTQQIGDDFIMRNEVPITKVPSAIVDGEYNYLLNPSHPGFSGVRIMSSEPFEFDSRLFKMQHL